MEEYIILYDECMYIMYSEEIDSIENAIEEDIINAALLEEYMWYKFEDWMLWKLLNN